MTLKVYYAHMSTSTITDCVLAELDIPCEKVKVDIRTGDNKKPEYLEINPNGKVPTIVHDGTAIWESAAITMYLGEVFGVDKKLYPASGPKRGEAMKWIAWANVTFANAVGRVYEVSKTGGDDPAHASAVEKAKEGVAECLKVLEGSLEGRPYLLGEEYSLADTHLLPVVHWSTMRGIDLASFPNVVKWVELCRSRPAISHMMKSPA